MGFFYWFNLFGPISLLVLVGVAVRINKQAQKATEVVSVCENKVVDRQSYLCGRKKPLASAKVHELARVHGISLKKAELIRGYLHEKPMALFSDLDQIQGIGPKTIARIREHFYYSAGH